MNLITFNEKSFFTEKKLSLPLFCEIINKVSPWLKPEIEFNPASSCYECKSKENQVMFASVSKTGTVTCDSQWLQIEYVEKI